MKRVETSKSHIQVVQLQEKLGWLQLVSDFKHQTQQTNYHTNKHDKKILSMKTSHQNPLVLIPELL